MKALLRKEATELAWPVLVFFAGGCWAWFALNTFEGLMLAPRFDVATLVALIAVVAGAVIGFVQFTAERWRGTLGFALHRGRSHRDVFLAKSIVGAAANLILSFGPLCAFAVWQLLTSPNAPIAHPQRIAEYGLCSLAGLSGHALGVMVSQLRRRWWFDVAVLALGSFGVVIVTIWLLEPHERSSAVSIGIYLAVQAAMTATFVRLSLALMRNAHDRELPLPRGAHETLVGVGVFGFVLPSTVILSLAANALHGSILKQYPVVARFVDTGKLTLMDRGSKELTSRYYATEGGRGHDVEPPNAAIIAYPTSVGFPLEPRQYNRVRAERMHCGYALTPRWTMLWWSLAGIGPFEVGGVRYFVEGFLDETDGTIRLSWTSMSDRSDRFEPMRAEEAPPSLPIELTIAKPAGGGRFSRTTAIVAIGRMRFCVVDFADHSLWNVSPTTFSNALSELSLPDGDRVVRLDPVFYRESARAGTYSEYVDKRLFVGEKTTYCWLHGGFERYTGQSLAEYPGSDHHPDLIPASQAEEVIELRPRQTRIDPIMPSVEVRDRSGNEVLFAHDYSPSGVRQHVEVALLYLTAALRPPLLSVQSFALASGEPSDPSSQPFAWSAQLEPLLAGGKRLWLLVLNLIVAGVCSTSIARRMKNQHRGPLEVMLAVSLTVCCGALAFAYLRGLMPKRASLANAESCGSEARELLIRSA